MKFSEHWLRSMIDPGVSSEALAELLTMAGLEVEACDSAAPAFSGVIVARVDAVTAHPSADRLVVCQVDIGAREPLAIVCGAPNVRPGLRVPCALTGARLPTQTVQATQVRGVQSNGMLCSERELGLGDGHEGVLELDGDAPLGEDLQKYLELDDRIFTLKLTPNRGDCLSILGLAREVAALTGKAFAAPSPVAVPVLSATRREVRLEAGPACPRYCGRVISAVTATTESPSWMRRRLERCGLRPISAIVDVTNYVMLELGQPLHAFDLSQMAGNVRVRFAAPSERLKLLDGREVTLDATHLVIADERSAIALAGVMGAEASAVSDTTTQIFLESAFFDPATVAAAARGLEIASDAAHRFERGVDFAIARAAIERATRLILDICGGQAGPITESLQALPRRTAVIVRPQRVQRVLGIDISAGSIRSACERLGMKTTAETGQLAVTAPSYRFDIEIEEDVIEEVARLHGYENIAPTLPVAATAMRPLQERTRSTAALKAAMAARDYLEVVTFSFTDRTLDADFSGAPDPVVLLNPLANQMSVMRTTLLGSLVECVRFNAARKQERVRIFEIAGCFSRDATAFRQTDRLAGLCYGPAHAEQWGEPARAVDFYDVRGDLEALLGLDDMRFEPAAHPAFHPGQCARVMLGQRHAGWLGALHPRWQQKYELAAATVGFELDLDAVRRIEVPSYRALPRSQSVRRDIAVVVDRSVAATALAATIAAAGGDLIRAVTVFDVYAGTGIPEGRKSLAFRVLLQDTEKTLTDVEVEARMRHIREVLQEKHGASLRS